jgi:hypothetical protein
VSLVENIKLLCKQFGTTIPKLGSELGFGKGAIYNWDTSSPSIDKVQKVADYFGVTINRVLYGFDANEFTNLTNIARGERTIVQFAKDTGIEHNELLRICLGLGYERPSLETVRKIASNNAHDWIFDEDKFLEAAGYISERQGEAIRQKILDEFNNQFEEAGFILRFENEDGHEKIYIDHPDHGTVEGMSLHELFERGESLLEELKKKYKKVDTQPLTTRREDLSEEEILTMAAHSAGHEGKLTEEQLAKIKLAVKIALAKEE